MLSQTLREMGVVGAGGAGFPTEVKARSQAEFVLANGAECEPLLHKDFELMKRYPAQMVSGMRRMMDAVTAKQGRFCIKEKNKEAVVAVEPLAAKAGIEMTLLGDFYPSGDEYEIVYAATGRLIPAAGIPLQVGCVVNNVETLYNVEMAMQGQPVTKKFLSVSGCVRKPCSFWAPLGCTYADLLEVAGGVTRDEVGIFVSGLMMGQLTFDLTGVVTKTTCGLIVLPLDHSLVQRKSRPKEAMAHIGKSACDQCSYCTEFCPRYLLGYDVQPHRVMRTLGFTLAGKENWSQWGELCCSCGLCTLYACPEDLYPKEACDQAKVDLRTAGIKFTQQKPVRVHPMKEYRRVPQTQLRQRLQVEQWEGHTPFVSAEPQPKRVCILTKQHAGKPAAPCVAVGAGVKVGEAIAKPNDGDQGAYIHSSIAGRVTRVAADVIEIEA
ncbi:MAG: 4Fe-4S dicluster domain-containing protein [Acidobacteria bacterium]|nr:4Fe-4S dicluster domain-containing protein [Acidobacteriota bacterium]